ncbi:unnamed protein product [Staurois parvus]|uniref:Uncharacterized protein n=1 Tax=Staurois parvus TaxID=386267 RepID=A0ABN9AAI7_9NEOB|nr:unnamed protein product [Staurois parvus]
MGPCTASSCCCQARNLPWAPVPPLHAAARPLICHGPLYRLLMLLPGPESLMGPCTASHCCCLHRHTLPCATFRSPHTAGGFHFVIGCCMPPIAAAFTATLWAPHSGFGPVTAQMSEVCAVILRSTALICMSHTDRQYYFSSPADSKGI